MLSTTPQTAEAFNTPVGAVVLLVSGVASIGPYLLMVRIGRLPEDERVLR